MQHHDALEFPDGRIVLLTKLSEGQEATVLQLPAQPAIAAEADAQKRVAYARLTIWDRNRSKQAAHEPACFFMCGASRSPTSVFDNYIEYAARGDGWDSFIL